MNPPIRPSSAAADELRAAMSSRATKATRNAVYLDARPSVVSARLHERRGFDNNAIFFDVTNRPIVGTHNTIVGKTMMNG